MADLPRITVIAGVNGAGKSSVAGAQLRASGGEYFNPDEFTRRIKDASPLISLADANSQAWEEGRKRLVDSIEQGLDFTFETTLGGHTITSLLVRALDEGLEVAVLYVGLATVDLHIARVKSRVQHGGHDISQDKVRARFTSSIQNLIKLAPRLTLLRLFDNSAEADPKSGLRPEPRELLYAEAGRIVRACDLNDTPGWAKPVFTVLLRNPK